MIGVVRQLACVAALAATMAACSPAAEEQGVGRVPSEGALTGWLLVAAPSMPDPRFAHTVIFVVRHGPKGAMGVVINRAVARGPIAKVLKGIGMDGEGVDGDIAIHYGGPVRTDSGFVLHSTDYAGMGTVAVNKHVSMSTNPKVLRDLGKGDGPKRSLFAIGYAGWGPGQLEGEIKRKDWFTIPGDDKLVFDDDVRTKWRRAMARRGVEL